MMRYIRAVVHWIVSITGPRFVGEAYIPPWWMGVAYRDYMKRGAVWCMVPVHHIVGIAWMLNLVWCRYRGRRSWIDNHVDCENRQSAEWAYKRLELLQREQMHMRDPERTLVCDILANGQLLPDPHGVRYGCGCYSPIDNGPELPAPPPGGTGERS